MTYPAPLAPHLLVGWQKVADRYNTSDEVRRSGVVSHPIEPTLPLGIARRIDHPEWCLPYGAMPANVLEIALLNPPSPLLKRR
jgi:hypothetical protein